VSDCCF